MKTFYALLLVGFALTSQVHAQYVEVTPERAMISYRDGSYFMGQILGRDHPRWKFRLNTGDTINLDPLLIDRMLSESDSYIFKYTKYHTKKGFFANSNLVLHAGWESSVQWDGTLGMGLTDRLDVGLGMGIAGHDLDIGNDWLFHELWTTYGYGRWYLNDRFMRLYLDSKLGYGFAIFDIWDDNYNGGLYFQPGIGVVIASKNAFKWNLGLSQYILNVKGNSTSWGFSGGPVEVDYNVWYNRTVFQIGLSLMITEDQLRNFSFF